MATARESRVSRLLALRDNAEPGSYTLIDN